MSDQHEVQNKQKFDWFAIKRVVIDEYLAQIGVHAMGVYLVLMNRANHETDRCFPGMKHIEEKTGLSRPTVIKAIRTLEEYGLIEVQHRRSASGDNGSNLYLMLEPKPLKGDLGGGKGDLPLDKKVVKEIYHLVNDVDHPSKGDLPPLVKEIDSNKTLSYQDITNKTTTERVQTEMADGVVDVSLVSELTEAGVTSAQARRLVKEFAPEHIRKHFEATHWRKTDNPPGGLVSAIREDWPIRATSSIPRPKRAAQSAPARPPEGVAAPPDLRMIAGLKKREGQSNFPDINLR